MNRVFTILLLFCVVLLYGQSKIKVYNAINQQPIKGAKIYCNDNLLAETDEYGLAQFTTKCTKVDVEAKDFLAEEVVVNKNMNVGLDKSKTNEIEAVVLSDKSDPKALAILDLVYKKFKDNEPNSLDSYKYKSYEKISFDLDQDSIAEYNKTVAARKDSLTSLNRKFSQKEKEKKDSLNGERMVDIMKESKLFLWERATEFLYSQKHGEKINVLDNRISGLKEPIYELLAIRSNRNRVPREILPENRNLYRYFLTDSIDIDGRENFVIRFRQVDDKKAQRRRKFNGYLYVDKESYAIKKIESNSKKKSDGNITSVWIPIENKWFLKTENLKMKIGSSSFSSEEKKEKETEEEKKERLAKVKKFGNYAYLKADYFDYETPIKDLNASQFKGYTMSVLNSDGSLLDKYRTDSLSQREKMAYIKIDSVGKAFKLDQKAKIFSGLMRGKIRVGMFDIDPRQMGYNKYEGFRLGAGFKFNEKFSRYISPDFYLAYGFRDKKMKYGVGLDVKTTLDKNSFFRAEYFNDVAGSGRFYENQWNNKMIFMNSGMSIQNNKYYKFDGFRFGYETDLSNSLTINVSAKRQNEEAGFDYAFRGLTGKFENFSTLATIKFSPNSKNIMTPAGKYTFSQSFPELYLNYEQGLKTLSGDFNYSRLDLLFSHQFRTRLGVTRTRVYGGYFSGNAPIWHAFEMGGLDSGNSDSFFAHFNLTTYLGFATMTSGKYFNDKFSGYNFSHHIPWYFKSFGRNTSSFDVVYKGIIGEMKNPQQHQFDYQSLTRLYQEVGLEYNNFLSTPFNLGLFYRVGHYATGGFKDNFAIQLKLKILGF